MSSRIGANVDQLHMLAVRFQSLSVNLAEARSGVSNSLAATFWEGPARTNLDARWKSAGAVLSELGELLTNCAHEAEAVAGRIQSAGS